MNIVTQELAENICKVFYSNTVTILECKYTDRAAMLIQQALDATRRAALEEAIAYINTRRDGFIKRKSTIYNGSIFADELQFQIGHIRALAKPEAHT